MSDRQADLRLVNLVSQGYTVAEAKKRLGIADPEPLKEGESAPPARELTEAEKARQAKLAQQPLGVSDADANLL